MNDVTKTSILRSRIVTGVVLGAIAVALVVFHEPLFAWFTGKPIGSASGPTTDVQAGSLSLHASLDPDPPGTSGNALVLKVADAAGHPVEGAKVSIQYDMAAMGAMPEMKGSAKIVSEKAGSYRAIFDLPMAGSWTLKTSVSAPAGSSAQDSRSRSARRDCARWATARRARARKEHRTRWITTPARCTHRCIKAAPASVRSAEWT